MFVDFIWEYCWLWLSHEDCTLGLILHSLGTQHWLLNNWAVLAAFVDSSRVKENQLKSFAFFVNWLLISLSMTSTLQACTYQKAFVFSGFLCCSQTWFKWFTIGHWLSWSANKWSTWQFTLDAVLFLFLWRNSVWGFAHLLCFRVFWLFRLLFSYELRILWWVHSLVMFDL